MAIVTVTVTEDDIVEEQAGIVILTKTTAIIAENLVEVELVDIPRND